jgi:hypothetical protein
MRQGWIVGQGQRLRAQLLQLLPGLVASLLCQAQLLLEALLFGLEFGIPLGLRRQLPLEPGGPLALRVAAAK